jgi:cobalt-precorrin-5B (C1)-methyltransferase
MSGLRTGFTTGTCAAAAAKAAALLLDRGRPAADVEIPLPDGSRATLPLAELRREGDGAVAAVRKDAGDDPDVTHGALVTATVCWSGGEGVTFAAGGGVGTVTKPGLAIPPGEAAINPVPRRMIAAAIREVTSRGVRVTVSIPGGAELARKTFNPRIGVVGGLSILGTTGIVRPFSCSAVRETIRCTLDVAAAAGIRSPVLVPGHIGARAAQVLLTVREEQLIEVSNEWGFALDEAVRRPFAGFTILGHPGKLAKLARGDWDTHSARSASGLPLVAKMHAEQLGRPPAASATVEGLFAALEDREKRKLGNAVAAAVRGAVAARTGLKPPPAVILIDLAGRILGKAGSSKKASALSIPFGRSRGSGSP